MQKFKKFLFSTIFVASFLFNFTACNKNDKKDSSSSSSKTTTSESSSKNIITEKKLTLFAENDTETAFTLLQKNAKIDFQQYDFGVFIKSINGVAGDNKNFWAFYVNGDFSNAGADKTPLKKGDKVEWVFEKMKY